MEKPLEILELEKILGREVLEVGSLVKIESTQPYPCARAFFFRNNSNKILGLKLYKLELKSIQFLIKFTNLKSINLKCNRIYDIRVLREIKDINHLNLGYNFIKDLSPLENSLRLTYLYLSNNPISNINPLHKLIRLTYLCISKYSGINNEWIVSNNQISNIQPLENLQQLKHLSLEGNSINDIKPLKEIVQLTYLNISSNKISKNTFILERMKMLKHLDLNANTIINIHFLSKLVLLNSLDLSFNLISDITPLKTLNQLERLYLNNNKVTNISSIKNLTKLELIDLSSNKIQKICLSSIKSISSLREIHLRNNPIQNIPKDIYNKHNSYIPIKTYLQDLQKGKAKNKDIKIILIGNGSVGKTQIAKRLEKQKEFIFDSQHDSTHGIILMQRKLGECNANIWDFAGQDIYHATHRLFMQTRALFVLVWDVKNEGGAFHFYDGKKYKNEKLLYWLEYAKAFGKGSPILVVQNKVDEEELCEFKNLEQAENYYKKHYPIIEFVQCSAKTGYNFDILEYWLEESFKVNQKLKDELIIDIPVPWANVRTDIRALQVKKEKLLSFDKFKELCEQEAILDSAKILAEYLHDTSVVYYRSGYFNDQIILDQTWVIDAVYAVLDRKSFYFRLGKIKKGQLCYDDLIVLWKDYNNKDRKIFIDFLLSTELCFETTENKDHNTKFQERTFVVPQLLPNKKPREVSHFWEKELDLKSFQESIFFQFLPAVFIQRFIVKAERFSNVEYMWQQGILLKWENHSALVEADYKTKQIHIFSNDTFLIKKIKEEIESISREGKMTARKMDQENDMFHKNEKYLFGLDGLEKNDNIEEINKSEIMSGSTKKQKIFILYSWDGKVHEQLVLSFCNKLREDGFDAEIDRVKAQSETALDFHKMMHKGITHSDKIIVVLSEGYKKKAESLEGAGVGFEYNLIIRDIERNPKKYIIVSFEGIRHEITPLLFEGRHILDLRLPDNFNELYAKLLDQSTIEVSDVANHSPKVVVEKVPSFDNLIKVKNKPKNIDTQKIRTLIGKARLKQALKETEVICNDLNDSDLIRIINSISSQYRQTERDNLISIIDRGRYMMEIAQVSNSLLILLDQIDEA